MDKPGADPATVRDELHQEGIMLEDRGGDVQAVEISALKGTNVEALVEAIVAQAELLQISADYKGRV